MYDKWAIYVARDGNKPSRVGIWLNKASLFKIYEV